MVPRHTIENQVGCVGALAIYANLRPSGLNVGAPTASKGPCFSPAALIQTPHPIETRKQLVPNRSHRSN